MFTKKEHLTKVIKWSSAKLDQVCVYAQTYPSLCCSPSQCMDVVEGSDQNFRTLSFAGLSAWAFIRGICAHVIHWACCICALFAISDDIFCALFAISIVHFFQIPIRSNYIVISSHKTMTCTGNCTGEMQFSRFFIPFFNMNHETHSKTCIFELTYKTILI